MNDLEQAFEILTKQRDLPAASIEALFDALISSADTSLIAQVLDLWSQKGASDVELFSLAQIMRDRVKPVNSAHQGLVDIVGTGGSKKKVFNVSTASTLVASGAGLVVAKHGNRAASSKTGSADVLSELGVQIETEPATAERILEKIGVCFMFAPKFHRLSATLAAARKSLRKPTIFNQLGPIVNPAGAPFQLIGVWDKSLLETMAEAVQELGTAKTWIVAGLDGLDEITLSGPTHVAEVSDGSVKFFDIAPEDFGFRTGSLDEFRDISAVESARIIRAVLDPAAPDSAARSLVTINAAAALYIGGHTNSLRDAAEMSQKAISSGRAAEKLSQLIEETNR